MGCFGALAREQQAKVVDMSTGAGLAGEHWRSPAYYG
jgi:hypothetical protein